jgi:hypothetical protein
VDKVNVTGLSFEEIQGLLVGVAGSSVNIRGLHAPYTPADEFCVVLIRSAYSRAHFIKNLDVESGMDVNALAEQILREAFVLRNAVVDLKTANIKVLYLQFICFASSKLQKLTPAASSPSSSLTSSTRMK